MNRLQSVVLAITLLTGGLSIATAQDFDKGVEAYRAGDYQIALREWRPLAEQGNSLAQSNLGNMYYIGIGVPRNYTEAVRWYRLAADQGFADAQRNLALMYRNGLGVLQSDVLTYMWSSIASANGNVKSDELRDELESQMTPTDLVKGSELAHECVSSNYQNCGG